MFPKCCPSDSTEDGVEGRSRTPSPRGPLTLAQGCSHHAVQGLGRASLAVSHVQNHPRPFPRPSGRPPPCVTAELRHAVLEGGSRDSAALLTATRMGHPVCQPCPGLASVGLAQQWSQTPGVCTELGARVSAGGPVTGAARPVSRSRPLACPPSLQQAPQPPDTPAPSAPAASTPREQLVPGRGRQPSWRLQGLLGPLTLVLCPGNPIQSRQSRADEF